MLSRKTTTSILPKAIWNEMRLFYLFFHIVLSQLLNLCHNNNPLSHNMFTYYLTKLKQAIETTLESSLLLVKSVFVFADYQPEVEEIRQVEIEDCSSLSAVNKIIANKRKYIQCINETTPYSATKRHRMASTSEDSVGENVIVSSSSSNKANRRKRKSVDLASLNTFESSKRRYMGSTSGASSENSRKRKAPHYSDEKISFDQDFQAFKRRHVGSSFDDCHCNIMVIYTDDSLSVNKYHVKSSSSIDTLPTESDDTFAIDDDQYSYDDFPIPLCIDIETSLYFQCY